MANSNDQEPDLPGLNAMTELFLIWTNGLREHSGTWSSAWKEMLAGKYGFGSLMRDFAKTYQNQYALAEQICRYPLKNISEEPPFWVNFDLRSSRPIAKDRLSQVASTREFDKEKFRPLGTDLTPFGPSRVRFGLKPEVVDATRIKVTINSMRLDEHEWLLMDSVTELNERLKVEYEEGQASSSRAPKVPDPYIQVSGQYLGMVFDSSPQRRTASPYLIVTLNL